MYFGVARHFIQRRFPDQIAVSIRGSRLFLSQHTRFVSLCGVVPFECAALLNAMLCLALDFSFRLISFGRV